VKSLDLWNVVASPASLTYAPSFWTPPCAHTHANATAVPSTSPRRAVMPRYLAVMCQRPAKGRFLLCLGAMWNRAYPVEGRGDLSSRDLSTGEMRPSRFPLGQTIGHLWGTPKPKGSFWVCTRGHTCSWPQKIQADPVRPAT
jgi:hypothetical protein